MSDKYFDNILPSRENIFEQFVSMRQEIRILTLEKSKNNITDDYFIENIIYIVEKNRYVGCIDLDKIHNKIKESL